MTINKISRIKPLHILLCGSLCATIALADGVSDEYKEYRNNYLKNSNFDKEIYDKEKAFRNELAKEFFKDKEDPLTVVQNNIRAINKSNAKPMSGGVGVNGSITPINDPITSNSGASLSGTTKRLSPNSNGGRTVIVGDVGSYDPITGLSDSNSSDEGFLFDLPTNGGSTGKLSGLGSKSASSSQKYKNVRGDNANRAKALNPKVLEETYGEGAGASLPNNLSNKSNLGQAASAIIQGEARVDPSVALLVADFDMSKDKIDMLMKKQEDMQRFLATRNSETLLDNRIINYDFKSYENKEIVIYLKKGYNTTIEFLNELEEPIRITHISAGSKIFNITQPSQNIITMEPVSDYRTTNMNIRLNDFPGNITFKVIESQEGYENKVDNLIRIVVADNSTHLSTGSVTKTKLNILKELHRYGTLKYAKELNYDAIDTSANGTDIRYFNSKDLKAYRIDKHGARFLVVKLDYRYELLGYSTKAFSRFGNTFNVYFLPYTTQVIDVIKKIDSDKNDTSSFAKFENNLGLGEKYRIIFK